MSSTFLGLTPRRQEILRNVQIPFETFRMGRQNGIIVDDVVLPRVLETFGSRVDRQENSSYEGIRIIHIKRGRQPRIPTAPATVVVESWSDESNGEIKEQLVGVISEFASQFGVDKIVLKDCRNGRNSEPPRSISGSFHIFFWSAASGQSHDRQADGSRSAGSLWGHNTNPDWRIWYPSPNSIVIKDNAGTDVAELVGDNLYVFYPITNARGILMESRAAIFRKILEEALVLRGFAPAEITARRAQQLREQAVANPVVIKRWEGNYRLKDSFIKAAAGFVRALGGKQIQIHEYDGSARRVAPWPDDGCIHVCIWASPGEICGDGGMRPTIFGAKLRWNEDQNILKATSSAGTLIADDDGNQVGMVINDTIYIHYPLTREYANIRWNDKGPEALFARILEEAVFVKTATEEDKLARVNKLAEEQRPLSQAAWVKACAKRTDLKIEENRQIIETNSKKVSEHQRSIVQLVHQAREAEVILRALDAFRSDADRRYTEEFNKMFELPHVVDVRARPDDDKIRVFTDVLFCDDPRSGECHEIGRFRLEIPIDGCDDVQWFNLTRHVDGYKAGMQAPHVFPDGRACLGNMSEVIPQLLANYEFAALAMICIQMIETVNVYDDAGRHIDKWPLAKKAR